MKILIIANPRTGSTYFSEWLANYYKLPYLFEPKYIDSFKESLDTLDKFCIKILIPQLYYYNKETDNLSVYEFIDKFYKFISNYRFDNILILDRKNQTNHIESLINLDRSLEKNTAFDEWVFDDNFKDSITENEWDKWKHYSTECKDWITNISNVFGINVIYYEDIYHNTDSVDLQGLKFKPDISKQLRKNSSNNII